jgi:hypothetical protein
MTDDITNDLALLDDWLAGKGYGEEAGLAMRAMDLIRKQADEIEKLRAAKGELTRLFDEAMDGYADCIPYKGDYLIKKHGDEENFANLRAAKAALKETD